MRTKQGTLRGYDNDGMRRAHGCRGWVYAGTPFCGDDELTPRDAKMGVQVLKIYGVWMFVSARLKGRMCPYCARDFAERIRERVRDAIESAS